MIFAARRQRINRFARNFSLTAKDIDDYCKNGVVCLRNCFTQEDLNNVQTGIEMNMKNPSQHHDWLVNVEGNNKDAFYFNDYLNYDNIEPYQKYVKTSRCSEIAGTLMQSSKSLFFHEHVFFKKGGSARATPWHHDQPYYPVDGKQNCTIWMPVFPVDHTSCLKFISGSHLWDNYFIPRKFSTNKEYEKKPESASSPTGYAPDTNIYESPPENNVEAEFEKRYGPLKILSWELQPGDCLAFNMKTLHGSDANHVQTTDRMVMATRWLGDDSIFASRPWETSPPTTSFKGSMKLGDSFVSSNVFPLMWEAAKSSRL